MAMIAHTFDMPSFSARVCGIKPMPQPVVEVQLDRLCADLVERIASVPQTPMDLAAQTTKELHPSWSRTYCREYVRALSRDGALDAGDQLILRRYQEALIRFRESGEVGQ